MLDLKRKWLLSPRPKDKVNKIIAKVVFHKCIFCTQTRPSQTSTIINSRNLCQVVSGQTDPDRTEHEREWWLENEWHDRARGPWSMKCEWRKCSNEFIGPIPASIELWLWQHVYILCDHHFNDIVFVLSSQTSSFDESWT